MGHYLSNVRDLEFNLFDVLGLDAVLASGAFDELDTETVRAMLAEVDSLATGPLGESFAESDRNSLVFDPAMAGVRLPEARFITSGDSDDLFPNTMHLVLARPVGAAPGSEGLSLFFTTGDLGDRNGVFVTGVENKMGLKVSATLPELAATCAVLAKLDDDIMQIDEATF